MTREMAALRSLRGFIFDMDGVIYRGAQVIPGAAEFIGELHARGIPHLYLTNNSTASPAAVVARIAGMGIAATPEQILTSAEAAAAALAQEHPQCPTFCVGEQGLREALTAHGLRIVTQHQDAEAVVVGLDRELTYARLRDAAFAIQRGALFIATNTDASLPTEAGEIPGAGAIVGMLEIATGRQARVIGKPSPDSFRMALARLGTPPEATAAVGDRAETDILGGQAAGLRTVGVLSGVGTAAQFAALRPPPDWVFADLAALSNAYLMGRGSSA